VFILFVTANMVSATVTFADEKNDVYYYEDASGDRDYPHTLVDVPEIDIESISCEVSTVGTTVVLNISGEFPMDFGEDHYSYIIFIFPDKEVYDYDNFFLRTNNVDGEWESYFSANEHTYTINGGTLSIFFNGMFLNESTVGFHIDAIHTDADVGADRDWYPDGEEKQSGLDTSTDGDGSDDGSVDNNDQSNEENTTDTPGFESMWLLVALSVIFFISRRHR
jgi:hypothetical protein